MGRRRAEPDRAARPGPRPEQPHGKATRAEADGDVADARPDGHCRRGHHRHRHVLPRRGLLRHPLPGPQQLRPVGQPGPAEARANRGRRRHRRKTQDRRQRRSPICRRPTARSARTTRPTAISISSRRRSIWWSGSWPRRRVWDRWARRRTSSTPAASCPSAATTPSGSTPPRHFSATSSVRTIGWRWRGDCRPRPTSNWCNWPSWPRPAKPGRAAPSRNSKRPASCRPSSGRCPTAAASCFPGRRGLRQRPRPARRLPARQRHARRQSHPR